MISFREYREIVHQGKANRMKVDQIYNIERQLSVLFSYGLLIIFPNLKPSKVSVANIILLLIVLGLNFYFLTENYFLIIIIQLGILRLAVIGDKVDGEVARYQKYFTQQGIYFDQMFHFFYPLVLMFSVGNYFSRVLDQDDVLVLSVFVALLLMFYKAVGKIRHHIKYKIKLENHQDLIKDYLTDQKYKSKRSPWRFVDYLLFYIYDWVWGLYLILVMGVVFLPVFGDFYLAHTLILGAVLLYKIFIYYPKFNLFSKDNLLN